MSQPHRSTPVLENLLFFWAGLTAILLFGGEELMLPSWVQVLGRLHPLVLHFPIVVLLIGCLLLWIKEGTLRTYAPTFLLIGANFAGLTVVAGLLLATEDYEGEALSWHKWTAVGSLALAIALYFLRTLDLLPRRLFSAALALLLVVAGHFGANLTHGEDFLLAPLRPTVAVEMPLTEAEVFRDVVQPILTAKCLSCHKEGKIKGELRMDHLEGLQKGGKSGPFVVAGNTEQSLLIQRIHLPLEHEDHMPPKNKLQLTEEEIEILRLWVLSGAGYTQKVVELPQEEPLFQLVAARFSSEKSYPFSPADEETVAQLTTFFRKVKPLYPGSPALEAAYFGSSTFDPASLAELSTVKNQVVKLTLSRMPLQQVNLDLIADFQNLEELNLNFTDITGEQLDFIKKLPKLENLALSGNLLDEASTKTLSTMTRLKKLFIWQTGLSDKVKNELIKALPNTKIEVGFDDRGIIYPLNPPKITFKDLLFTGQTEVLLSHPIPTVEIRYTLDGSLPDSLSSKVYSGPITLKKSTQVRTRAFAKNWIGSLDAKAILFQKGFTPPSFSLASPPSPNYTAKGAASLFDGIKGKPIHTNGEWLGFTDNAFDLELSVNPQSVPRTVEISLLLHESAYIFHPQAVAIWTGTKGKWTQVPLAQPPTSTAIGDPRYGLLSYTLPSSTFDQVRIKLSPIAKLPAWHPGKGAKGWVFVDEILLH
jgi:hypothetical protein